MIGYFIPHYSRVKLKKILHLLIRIYPVKKVLISSKNLRWIFFETHIKIKFIQKSKYKERFYPSLSLKLSVVKRREWTEPHGHNWWWHLLDFYFQNIWSGNLVSSLVDKIVNFKVCDLSSVANPHLVKYQNFNLFFTAGEPFKKHLINWLINWLRKNVFLEHAHPAFLTT